jgi:outer membrane lipoprotein-sorting protein
MFSARGLGTAIVVGVFASSPWGAPPSVSPVDLLKKADAAHDAFTEGIIRLRVVANERGKQATASELQLYVQGADRSLLVFREGKQKGRRILTQGDKVFLIVPNSTRPVPVSKTQRLMGAASFGDIARLRFADTYDATLRPAEETITVNGGATRCHVLELKARTKGAAYPTAVLWLGVEDGLARRLRLSLASGKEAKDVTFARYDDQHRIATMEIRDLMSAGGANVTQLDFSGYVKQTLDPALFEPEGALAAP